MAGSIPGAIPTVSFDGFAVLSMQFSTHSALKLKNIYRYSIQFYKDTSPQRCLNYCKFCHDHSKVVNRKNTLVFSIKKIGRAVYLEEKARQFVEPVSSR